MNDKFFPGLPADTFRAQSTYDYSLWGVGTKLKLCNINWRNDYRNTVKFADDAARNAYFDKLNGSAHELESEYRMLPDGTIKLPLPFDEVMRYNYLMIDFGTSPNPLETDKHVSRFFFFVDRCAFAANNTTELVLSLDEWTTYINRIDISYMMLERGHAPVAAVDAETYLKNPLQNNRYLLADDFNFGAASVTSRADFVPFGNGKKYVLVATTIPWESLTALGEISDISAEGPGYHNSGDRNGYAAEVTTLNYAAGGRDYSGAALATGTAGVSGGSIPNNLNVFAVAASDCYGSGRFFDIMAERYPQLLESVQAVYIVDESMIELGESKTIFSDSADRCTWSQAAVSGKTWAELTETHTYEFTDANSAYVFYGSLGIAYTIYEVRPANNALCDISLSVEDFGYPDEYKDLAKLYTSPYAHIEVTDTEGRTAVVNIEDTGSIRVWQRVSLAAPYMRYDAYLSGVGTDDTVTYEWRDVSGNIHNEVLPGGDFRELLFGYDIPSYALYMSGYDKYRLHNYNTANVTPRIGAETAYENAARGANTGYENTRDATNKAYTNTALTIEATLHNTKRSAAAAYNNATAGNAAAQANANASAATSYENTAASNETAQSNANANAAAGYKNTSASANAGLTNTMKQSAVSAANATRAAKASWDNSVAAANTSLTNAKLQAETSKTEADRNASVGKTNAYNAIDTERQNITNDLASQTAQLNVSNAAAVKRTDQCNSLQQALQAYDAGYSRALTDTENQASAISAVTNAIASGAGAVSALATGDVGGAIGGAVSAVGTGVSYAVTANANSTKTELGVKQSQNKLNETTQNNTQGVDLQVTTANTNNATNQNTIKTNADNNQSTGKTNADNVYNAATSNNALTESTSKAVASNSATTAKSTAENSYSAAVSNANDTREQVQDSATRSYAASIDNAARSRDTSNANAQRTRDTGDANAERSRDTSNANAQRTRNTGDVNAKRTYDAAISNLDESIARDRANAIRDRDTALANAEYTRNNSVESAQRNLKAAAEQARAAYLDRKLDPAVRIGSANGDPVADEMRWRGLQVQVKTQNAGEISQAGDLFRRYGYALNQMWRFEGFNIMRHFTYWKCADVWVTSSEGVIESARRTIETALRNGVTVWSNPDEIGKVSIYAND